jgi:hypothetical protein
VAPPAKKKTGLVIGIVAGVVLAAGGAAAFFVLGKKDKTQTVAQAGSAQVAAGSAVVAEPVKTEPGKTEPVKTEPAGSATAGSAAAGSAAGSATEVAAGSASEPVKTEPVKTEPVKTEPVKPTDKTTDKTIAKTDPTKTTKTEPPKAARLGTVALTIGGAPRGAVFVDGKLVAREVSDISLELAPGDHRIRVESPNHKPEMQVVHVTAGAKQDLKVTLKKKSINTVHDPFAD